MLSLSVPNNMFSMREQTYINCIPLVKESWNITTEEMNDIKFTIKCTLWKLQKGKCVYCMSIINPITVSGEFFNDIDCDDYSLSLPYDGDREHILPKSIHPEFIFHPINLALACKTCNTKKKNDDVCISKNTNYSLCTFSIVHPYLDVVSDHIIFENDILIKVNSNSIKGKTTINLFNLNSVHYTRQRGMEMLIMSDTTSPEQNKIISRILNYRQT